MNFFILSLFINDSTTMVTIITAEGMVKNREPAAETVAKGGYYYIYVSTSLDAGHFYLFGASLIAERLADEASADVK